MASNHGVVYLGQGKVKVQSIDYPELKTPRGKQIYHGVIVKPITTNICGSDQHMVRGRTTAPPGMVLGHEITGEVIECGRGVEFISKGDIVSVPFNVACGRCRNCKERHTDVCLNVNPGRAGGAYGYVDLGGWVGGQAEYVIVPYADWNLLKFPDKDQALAKIRDLTCLSDILPTGYHGCVSAGVTAGSTVLISGAGPVGLAAASAAFLLGAAVVIVADFNRARLEHAHSFGCETIDLSKGGSITEHLENILRVPEVDCAVDSVGFEAKGHGGKDEPAVVLNQLMEATRAAGAIGIPGLYVTEDPGAKDEASKRGNLTMRLGLGWAKSHSFTTGQTPVMEVQSQPDDGDPSRSHPDCEGGQRRVDIAGAGARGLPVIRFGRAEEIRHRPASQRAKLRPTDALPILAAVEDNGRTVAVARNEIIVS
jgi:glutathione-independent formaldehyde dehydrogenase